MKMGNPTNQKPYTPTEERINVASHLAGAVLGAAALVLLVVRAARYGTGLHVAAAGVFGASLVVLYTVSTLYHRTADPVRRARLRVADHAAIYVLIAGTYTPFTLLVLPNTVGWAVFTATWAMAAAGITLKLFFTGRYEGLSTAMYLFMGWMIVFAFKPLVRSLSPEALAWVVAGGLAYTAGAALYAIERIRLNHALFHLLVLTGSASHFVAVYRYVLPGPP